MNTNSLQNILSGSVPLSLLREDYKVELSNSVYLTGADGSRYVSNKTTAEFMMGSTKKRLDKEASHKRIMAMQNNNDSGTGSPDYKGRLD